MKEERIKKKICLISSSGGHFEQLKMLSSLGQKYDIYFVTEKTAFDKSVKYRLLPGCPSKFVSFLRLVGNFFLSLRHIIKEKPNVIVSTGTMVAIPTIILAKFLRKKIIYIETFARVHGGTKAGRYVYKHHLANLFIYQWETQKDFYPNGVFGGSIY